MVSSVTIGTLVIDGDPYTISQMGGLGSASVETTAYPRPTTRGSGFIRSTYRDRRVSITGAITGSSVSNYLENRRELFKALDVTNGLFTVKFTLQDGLALQFEAVVDNPIEAPFLPGRTTIGDYLIELKAPDPAFYSQTLHSHTVGLASGETVTNAGNLAAYPTVSVYGPGTNFTINIYSDLTGIQQTMILTGTLASGEHYAIDPENKTVYRNGSINSYSVFSGDWWTIQAETNDITFACASGSDQDTRLELSWRDVYIGI